MNCSSRMQHRRGVTNGSRAQSLLGEMELGHALLFGFILHQLVKLRLAHDNGKDLLLVVGIVEDSRGPLKAIQREGVVVLQGEVWPDGEVADIWDGASVGADLKDVLEVDELCRTGFEGSRLGEGHCGLRCVALCPTLGTELAAVLPESSL
jgi:hypothetical protein